MPYKTLNTDINVDQALGLIHSTSCTSAAHHLPQQDVPRWYCQGSSHWRPAGGRSQLGRPTKTGRPWSKQEMWEAVAQGPYKSSPSPKALAHFTEESVEKVQAGQAKLVLWNDIQDNPPALLRILPIAAIPHKLKAFCSIFDLSFRHQLKHGGFLDLVNNTKVKLALQGALDQLGHALSRIIHVFAESDDNAKIFMAKWDIKDGFWQMDCEAGKECSFAYALPQDEGKPITLVVPTS
jgi:hypothetical protein